MGNKNFVKKVKKMVTGKRPRKVEVAEIQMQTQTTLQNRRENQGRRAIHLCGPRKQKTVKKETVEETCNVIGNSADMNDNWAEDDYCGSVVDSEDEVEDTFLPNTDQLLQGQKDARPVFFDSS